MHLDVLLIAASALVGLLVGMTGTGGGALMTPMLVLLFGVAPSAAIASDLVATLLMRPAGAAVHWRRHTVEKRVAGLLCAGSVPAAFAGTYLLHALGSGPNDQLTLERILGGALVIGAGAMFVRFLLNRRSAPSPEPLRIRPVATVVTGVVGGFMVGLTSVGAGSLMMVALMLLYPTMASDRLVGTDLVQSVPLAIGASAGALLFGHVGLSITVAVALGAVPATLVGSLVSSRRANFAVRPLITGVVMMSGLKYLGLPTAELVATLLPVTAMVIVSLSRHGRAARLATEPAAGSRPPD